MTQPNLHSVLTELLLNPDSHRAFPLRRQREIVTSVWDYNRAQTDRQLRCYLHHNCILVRACNPNTRRQPILVKGPNHLDDLEFWQQAATQYDKPLEVIVYRAPDRLDENLPEGYRVIFQGPPLTLHIL